MLGSDMSISEMLHDPLVRQMLRADRVSLADFAVLLKNAAVERSERIMTAKPVLPECLLQYSTAQASLLRETKILLKLR